MRNITVTGNLGADATVEKTNAGTELLTFRIASSERYDKDESGNPRTMWFRVRSKEHKQLLPYLTKGKGVIVFGSYRDHLFTRNDGQVDISRDIFAYDIEFWSAKKEETTPNTQQQPTIAPTTVRIAQTTQTTQTTESGDDLPF